MKHEGHPRMLVYTSVTKSYIPKARTLAKSVKKFHPDWQFVLLLSDDVPMDFDIDNEPFDELLSIYDLGIKDFELWVFKHSIVELCTAVKGRAGVQLANREGVDKIIYLDPDTRVYSSLSELEMLLESHSVLLTPHLLVSETEEDAIVDNEISVLKHGLYNLGFMAANSALTQGRDFLAWWAKRLDSFCFDDIPGGLFTDQKWCDLVPIFFDEAYIIRDPGYNVATWNLAHRELSVTSDQVICAGHVPLRFYHYTGYDSGDGRGMLMKYAGDQEVAKHLWESYGAELVENGNGDESLKSWKFSCYESGSPIPSEARTLYRKRKDLRDAFSNPFSSQEPSFESWYVAEVESGGVSRPKSWGLS